MTNCNENTPPVRCMEAFNGITEKLGRMSGQLDAIHQQTQRTHDHVENLFRQTGRHETQIQLLLASRRDRREGEAQWSRRIWQLVVGLALLMAGYFIG